MRTGPSILAAIAALLAAVASACGLFWPADPLTATTFEPVQGETVALLGRGLYRLDSLILGAGFLGEDAVTLFLAVPATLVAAWQLWRRPTLAWLAILAMLLSFLLYVYATMSLAAFYGPLFLVYVATFSVSFFALVLSLLALDRALAEAWPMVGPGMPRRSAALLLATCGVFTGLIWIQPLLASLFAGAAPPLLGHSTTKVTEALDLAIIVPGTLVAASLIWRRRPAGYTVAVPLLGLLVMLAPTIAASTVSQVRAGVVFTIPEIAGPIGGFLVFGVLGALVLAMILRAAGSTTLPSTATLEGRP
jgi:hypothetical protein